MGTPVGPSATVARPMEGLAALSGVAGIMLASDDVVAGRDASPMRCRAGR